MKKLVVTCLMIIGLVSFSTRLDAADCNGGSIFYYCDEEDLQTAVWHMFQNCCEGSYIVHQNVCEGTEPEVEQMTGAHGHNSSCTPQ